MITVPVLSEKTRGAYDTHISCHFKAMQCPKTHFFEIFNHYFMEKFCSLFNIVCITLSYMTEIILIIG
jgi:hypothetical protein